METLTFSATVDIQAAEAGKQPRVSIIAYTGGLMSVQGFGAIAIDLAGLQVPSSVNLLADHDSAIGGIVGSGSPTIAAGHLTVDGTLATSSEAAGRIVALAKEGIQFQASVGVKVDRSEYIDAGKAVTVNGRGLKADKPFTLVRAGILREVSIVAIGADSQTSVSIAAKGTKIMVDEPTTPDLNVLVDICGTHTDLLKAAVAEHWSEDKTKLAVAEAKLKAAELELMRANRGRGPAIHDAGRMPDDRAGVASAAILLHTGQRNVAEAFYKDEVLTAAESLKVRHAMDWRDKAATLLGVSGDHLQASGVSTVSLSGILGDSARKSMEVAYRAAPSAARLICRKLTAKDFKDHTGYRLTGDFKMLEVGAGGELKHATIDEQSYTYSVDTYGRIFGITRQNWINDDLGAFAEIPRMIGRGAALALEEALFTLLLANTSSFFGTGNSNYISGGGSALGSAGLKAAVQKLRDQTDADGNPVMLTPKYLLVPTTLEETADELYVSTNIIVDGNSSAIKVPDGNTYRNKYVPVISPYLNNSSFTGYSTTAWYLLADPADVAAFGIAYLNGMESPTVEEMDVRNDILGNSWRGYLDFGVCQIDHRGGVMNAGT